MPPRKRKFPSPYSLADSSNAVLSKRILKLAAEAKQRMMQFKFDELNVMDTMRVLYLDIDKDCRRTFKKLYHDRFTEMWLFLKDKQPDEDELDELLELELERLFEDVDEQTHYIWSTELNRKRDKATEAIWASPSKLQKQLEVDKGIRWVSQQIGFYMDIVSDKAAFAALKEAGVDLVMWNAQEDTRVCKTCERLDGEIFELDRIPEKPHLRCRCWLSPA